jgi:hypothetical protein
MSDYPRHSDGAHDRACGRGSIDEQLLARAAAINESVASEFAERAVSPLDNPVIDRMAELGVETGAAVSVALERAHRIAFYMRRARTPQDPEELSNEAERLSAEDRAHVAALAVAWWDGALTALGARELQDRERRS